MGFTCVSALALATVLLSLFSVESFTSNQRLHVRSSTTTVYMAGGRVPLVPYYPNKAQGSKDYQWMDIYNALGRERWDTMLSSPTDSYCDRQRFGICDVLMETSREVGKTSRRSFASSLKRLIHMLPLVSWQHILLRSHNE